MRGLAPILLSLLVTAGLGSATSVPGTDGPKAADSLSIAGEIEWRAWIRAPWTFRSLVVDDIGDRVLVAAAAPGQNDSSLLVFDRRGTILANVSLQGASPDRISLALDPSSGRAFAVTSTAILRLDPATGTIVDRWTLPFQAHRAVAQTGRLYVSSDDLPIQIVDASNGTVLGSVPGVPNARPADFVVHASGSWLLASYPWPSDSGTIAVNLSSGTTRTFPLQPGTFAPPLDERVFACEGLGFQGGTLTSIWPANGTVIRHPVFCAGPLAQNPVTGVVHDALGSLLTPSGRIGITAVVGLTQRIPWFAWTADGRALVSPRPSIRDLPSSPGLEVGAWEGTPRIAAHSPLPGTILDPASDRFCFRVWSASGMDPSTVHSTVDGHEPPAPLDLFDSFDCMVVRGFPDGHHSLRVVGTDLLGDRLDGIAEFDTDGSPPVIAVTSSPTPSTSTYEVRGTAEDFALASVQVNGAAASVQGTSWFLTMRLPFGDTRLTIRAQDRVGHSAEAAFRVRYWPPIGERVMSAEGRFSLPVPPEWDAVPSAQPAGGVGFTLYDPGNPSDPTLITIVSRADRRATDDPAYAVDRARDLEAFIESGGGAIMDPAEPGTIAGHPAATIHGLLAIGSSLRHYVRAVVVLPEWSRIILVTAIIPHAVWDFHAQDMAWILEGLAIDPAPERGQGSRDQLGAWIGASSLVAGVIVAALLVIQRMRRKGT